MKEQGNIRALKEVTVAAAPPSTPPTGPVMAVSFSDYRPAELVLAGQIGAETLRELEERLATPPLREATEWMERYRAFWDASLDRLDVHLQRMQQRSDDT